MSLFPSFASDFRPTVAARLAPKLRALAEQGVYFGTSSWKYEGWLGSIYDQERYRVRGKFSKKRFEDDCLSEYAETFPVVGGDFSFYQFPTPAYWQKLFGNTPAQFKFALKVPEDITVARWPGHARYGTRAGELNEGFLNATLFTKLFAKPLVPYRDRVAAIMFEFGTFNKSTFATSDDFHARLAQFLGELPGGIPYAVEIRNPEYYTADHVTILKAHKVAHVFNAWTRMPSLPAQLELAEAADTADFTVARALLKCGRNYEDAVRLFEPYLEIQEPDLPSREGLKRLAKDSRRRRRPAFLLVNNRLEGNAPGTIEAVADELS
jgi:uncharacterized protein YecE (DUF72 family)